MPCHKRNQEILQNSNHVKYLCSQNCLNDMCVCARVHTHTHEFCHHGIVHPQVQMEDTPSGYGGELRLLNT